MELIRRTKDASTHPRAHHSVRVTRQNDIETNAASPQPSTFQQQTDNNTKSTFTSGEVRNALRSLRKFLTTSTTYHCFI